MTHQFAFLEGKHKGAIVLVMSLSVLLFLPASLGLGSVGTTIIIQEAFGQFNLPFLEDGDEETTDQTEEEGGLVIEEEQEEEGDTTTTPTTPPSAAVTTDTLQQDPSTYLTNPVNRDALRGLIGSKLPEQSAAGTTALTPDDSGYVATGRFRLFANETIVRRFITEMNVVAIDGTSFHNITIEEGAPHRFPVTQGNGSTTSSDNSFANIVARIYLDGGTTPVVASVPMTLTIRGQTLAIENIDIDEARITDPEQRDALSAIDGQRIYGTIT